MDAFKVVCDENTNTTDRVARGELWVSILVRPTPTAEFIVVNVVSLRSGGNFSSEAVLAAGGVTGIQTAV
jgi:hypothetical protein